MKTLEQVKAEHPSSRIVVPQGASTFQGAAVTFRYNDDYPFGDLQEGYISFDPRPEEIFNDERHCDVWGVPNEDIWLYMAEGADELIGCLSTHEWEIVHAVLIPVEVSK
jgi:hypothetical protein